MMRYTQELRNLYGEAGSKMAIRYLKNDDPIPTGAARRYTDSRGYVRLRWKVGPNQYIEAWEHRILAGRPQAHVHHVDHDPSNNSKKNLASLSVVEHLRLHGAPRRIPIEKVAAMYVKGMSPAAISAAVGFSPGGIANALRRTGMKMRSPGEYRRKDIDPRLLRKLLKQGLRPDMIAARFGISDGPIRRMMRELGIPSFPAGRPPSR